MLITTLSFILDFVVFLQFLKRCYVICYEFCGYFGFIFGYFWYILLICYGLSTFYVFLNIFYLVFWILPVIHFVQFFSLFNIRLQICKYFENLRRSLQLVQTLSIFFYNLGFWYFSHNIGLFFMEILIWLLVRTRFFNGPNWKMRIHSLLAFQTRIYLLNVKIVVIAKWKFIFDMF